MNKEIRQRLTWVKLYEESKDAGFVCRRCGISRPTLRKWWRRYQTFGVEGLASQSRRPLSSPNAKISPKEEALILELRQSRNLGARRLQSELVRLHQLSFSLATIHKVLTRNEVKPLKKIRKKTEFIRYERPTPGDRVQMDTCKIAPGIYQYTSVDDCTRYRVLRLYKRRTAANTLHFIDCVIEEMPFPIQRIQTDRGLEFFAEKVQKRLMANGIKFRPNKPGSPHLNGKVERSQKTDKTEFYPTVDIYSVDINEQLAEWQHYYNWDRPHSAHKGKSPMEKYFDLSNETPYSDEVAQNYDSSFEHVQLANYQKELALQKLK
ncbi:IS481 family transposase [Aliikangiella sp. IMCC44359]|uniref:IS481 family transposase n=1 Tax=Aliikangiella sp. IMCC44359 TaxID=3459125 RepID=UPI00403AE680